MTSLRVIVSGRVQGVGFRYTTKELARGFDVCGTVRNLPDATVEIIIAGERDEVESFLQELTTESAVAHHVKSVLREPVAPPHDLRGFQIVR